MTRLALCNGLKLLAGLIGGVAKMSVPTNDKLRMYSRYAAHCSQMAIAIQEQESRSILREMAVEWIKLADALSFPHERKFYKLRGELSSHASD